jgi:hypothetical protein
MKTTGLWTVGFHSLDLTEADRLTGLQHHEHPELTQNETKICTRRLISRELEGWELDENAQPRRAFRLDNREFVYSFANMKLNARWLACGVS